MDRWEPLIVVADTSVLINFLKLDRMDLLARHPSRFLVTDHVSDEVTRHYASQRTRLEVALETGILQEHPVTDEQDVALFGKLCLDLGLGNLQLLPLPCIVGMRLPLTMARPSR